jgi:Protein of unknown function (DUF1826)
MDGCAQYPWPSLTSRPTGSPDTDSVLSSHYVYRPVNPIRYDLWEGLCPPSKVDRSSTSPSQVDVSGTWTPDENPDEVARILLGQCDPGSTLMMSQQTVDSLAASLSESLGSYRDFCQTHLITDRRKQVRDYCCVRFRYRLVATRGPSGTKCPLYHIDHVPVRWIQTFVGPGVDMVVGDAGIRWDAFESHNENDDDDVSLTDEDLNDLRVDATAANVYHAGQGEAVVMIGKEFRGTNKGNPQLPPSSSRLRPVVHKSPKIPIGQARVRLTQDVEFH